VRSGNYIEDQDLENLEDETLASLN
jgi:hypothetical protein